MSEQMTRVADVVDLLSRVDRVTYNTGWESKSLAADAIREITRLRTLLSEAEQKTYHAETMTELQARAYVGLLAKKQESDQQVIAILRPIAQAVEVNDGDTLSSFSKDEKRIWTATGSWSCDAPITLGDLRKVAELSRALQSEER